MTLEQAGDAVSAATTDPNVAEVRRDLMEAYVDEAQENVNKLAMLFAVVDAHANDGEYVGGGSAPDVRERFNFAIWGVVQALEVIRSTCCDAPEVPS